MLAARNKAWPLSCTRGVQGEWDRQALNNGTDLSIPLITTWTRGSAGVPDTFCLPLHIHTLLSPPLSVLKADSCSLRQMVLLFSASGWDWADVGVRLETRGREGSAAGVFMSPGPWGLTEGPAVHLLSGSGTVSSPPGLGCGGALLFLAAELSVSLCASLHLDLIFVKGLL